MPGAIASAILMTASLLGAAGLSAKDPAPRVPETAGEVRDRPAAKKDGLSLSISMDKSVFGPGDDIVLKFRLRNGEKKDLFIGDGFLAPGCHEAGPQRHFEVEVTADDTLALRFWSGALTEGTAAGIRKVFRLKPGEAYEGRICLTAGNQELEPRSYPAQCGTLSEKKLDRRHVLGRDGRRYSVFLRYRSDPKAFTVVRRPSGFTDELLWAGTLTSSPLEFRVAPR